MSVGLILLAILGISVLVIVHETGHFLVARAYGMRVVRFSIGIGPKLFQYKPADSPTTFQVCAIPFLAYVQIAGMNPHEEYDEDDPSLFPNQPLMARVATVAAGPIANYLIAALLTFVIALVGWPDHLTRPVVDPMEESPAALAGIKKGDVIVQVGSRQIETFNDLVEATTPRAGMPTDYYVDRDGTRLGPFKVTPENKEGRGMIGVSSTRYYRSLPVSEALVMSVTFPYKVTILNFLGLADLFKRRTLDGLAGPVKMGHYVAESARRGPMEYAWMLIVLSVALGMFNLLPLPALDGGRLAFLGYEFVLRRRPNEKIEAAVHMVGLMLLLSLLVLVTFRDVSQL